MAKKKKKLENLPEGMTRREAKLAARAAARAELDREPRPFGGLAVEAELIALQEFVPSACARTKLVDGTEFTLGTVLPGAVAAYVTEDGERFVALQTTSHSQNRGRDLAFVLNWLKDAAPGSTLESARNDGSQPELKEIFNPESIEVVNQDTFEWWPGNLDANTLARFNDSIVPSFPVTPSAWWVDAGDKAHIRWVRTDEEQPLLDALARVSAAGNLNLGENTKFAGVFRTHGVLVPVFDLDPAAGHDYADQLAEVDAHITKALAVDAPLTSEERRALENIKSRQVTIR